MMLVLEVFVKHGKEDYNVMMRNCFFYNIQETIKCISKWMSIKSIYKYIQICLRIAVVLENA